MGEVYADVCDRCGNTVVKNSRASSSDMIAVKSLELVYLSDKYLPGKLSRPSLSLGGRVFCPYCLVAELSKWAETLKTLSKSKVRCVVDTAP